MGSEMCIRDRYTWADATYVADNQGGGDIYAARMLPETTGDYTFACLLYTSDAADERSSVDLGGRRIIKKKKHYRNSSCRRPKQKQSTASP